MDFERLEAATIGLVGYGEVGGIFADAFRAGGCGRVSTWDIRFDDASVRAAERGRARSAGILACESMADLVARNQMIFSAVTASQTLVAAQQAAIHLSAGKTFVDLNSVSPGTKRRCAELIEATGAAYVEAAIMASVPPYGVRVPILLGGPTASACAPLLRRWGMEVNVVSATLGVASAIKMCRSVVMKGFEALVVEAFTAARAYGVDDAVLASLAETFPGVDWERQGTYFFERVLQHGRRRSEEMHESAATVAGAGLEAYMALAAAQRQAWLSGLAGDGRLRPPLKDWRSAADAVLSMVAPRQSS